MTDLSVLTADQLAEKVTVGLDQIVDADNPVPRAALSELARRASERDQAARERDEARVAFLENPLWIQQVAETRRLRDALEQIEVIRMAAAGPNKPLPHSARVEIGQIARSALAAGGGKAVDA